MIEYYCYRDYPGYFERGKFYKGERVPLFNTVPKRKWNYYIRVFVDDINSIFVDDINYEPSSDETFYKLSDYFLTQEEWREKQISKIIL